MQVYDFEIKYVWNRIISSSLCLKFDRICITCIHFLLFKSSIKFFSYNLSGGCWIYFLEHWNNFWSNFLELWNYFLEHVKYYWNYFLKHWNYFLEHGGIILSIQAVNTGKFCADLMIDTVHRLLNFFLLNETDEQLKLWSKGRALDSGSEGCKFEFCLREIFSPPLHSSTLLEYY